MKSSDALDGTAVDTGDLFFSGGGGGGGGGGGFGFGFGGTQYGPLTSASYSLFHAAFFLSRSAFAAAFSTARRFLSRCLSVRAAFKLCVGGGTAAG